MVGCQCKPLGGRGNFNGESGGGGGEREGGRRRGGEGGGGPTV